MKIPIDGQEHWVPRVIYGGKKDFGVPRRREKGEREMDSSSIGIGKRLAEIVEDKLEEQGLEVSYDDEGIGTVVIAVAAKAFLAGMSEVQTVIKNTLEALEEELEDEIIFELED